MPGGWRAFSLAGALVLFCAVAARAQGALPTAVALAKRVDQHYNSLHSLEVQFTQNYEGMGMNRKEAGWC